MQQPINRQPPKGHPGMYKTYRLWSPPDTHIVESCQQAGCEAWQRGWDTFVDEATELGQRQAAYIRTHSGRTFRESRTDAGITAFRFEAHQRCFAEHRTRPSQGLVLAGDYRGFDGVMRRHTRTEDFVDDATTALDAMKQAQERG